jgi:hypothetical protein
MDPRPMPRVERADVPRALATVIARALEKDLARRIPDARVLGKMLQTFVPQPSPATKLAFDELDAIPSTHPLSIQLDPDDDTTQASTVRAVVKRPMDDDRTSLMPPRRSRRPRPTIDMTSRETRYVLAGSAILALATILIAATSTRRPRPAPVVQPVPVIYVPPTVTDAGGLPTTRQ